MDALIGATGFIGSTLLRQRSFDIAVSSATSGHLHGKGVDLLVCAGAPGLKWKAIQAPAEDEAAIDRVANLLDGVRCDQLVLISTVDVFADNRGRTEADEPGGPELTAYGANRLWLENFARRRFKRTLIVRLTGVVGPGLRKNQIYDLAHRNALHLLDERDRHQFYPVVNLWPDIVRALALGLEVVHLVAEPVSLGEVAREAFGNTFDQRRELHRPSDFDLRSAYGAAFGGSARYQYDARESILAIRAYAQALSAARGD